jgi:hypothetical protein
MASASLNFVGMDKLSIHSTVGALIPTQCRLVAKTVLDLVAVGMAIAVEEIMGEAVAAVLALEVIQVMNLVVVGVVAAALVAVLKQRQLPLVVSKRNAGTTPHLTLLTVRALHDRPSQGLTVKLMGKQVVLETDQTVCVLVQSRPSFKLGRRLMLLGHLPNTFCWWREAFITSTI